MARNVRPARIAPVSAVFDQRAGSDPRIEAAVEVNGDIRLNRHMGGRPPGFNAIPRRIELYWPARRLPQLNAVADPTGSDTYNTNATIALNNVDRDFEVLGSNAVSTDAVLSAEGGVTLATHGGGTDATLLAPHLNTGQSPWTTITWGTDQESTFEWDIITGASVGNACVIYAKAGLTNVSVVATDDDKVMFRYTAAASGGNWEAVTSIGNADVQTNTGVPVTAATRYHLKIVIDSARFPHYFIGVGVGGETKLVFSGPTALTDATDFIPYVGILEASAAVKNLRVLGIAASRNYA